MRNSNQVAALLLACLLLSPNYVAAQVVGRITGVGGVIVTSKDPNALTAWYRDVLGIPMEKWGGAAFHTDAIGHPPMVLWSALPANSEEVAPSKRDFMISLTVDNLDAFVDRLKTKGVAILKREDEKFGRFAFILDPDGVKIELWQPLPH